MVKYVNEIGLPHLYLMWVMLSIKISLVLKFLSGAWKMIEIFFPNKLAFVSFIKRPNKLYVFTVIRYLTILVATFSKIASSTMFFFFQNQVFGVVCKQNLYNIFCLILNSTRKQNTPLSYSVAQP